MSEGQSNSTLHPFLYNLEEESGVERGIEIGMDVWLLPKHAYVPVDMHTHSQFKIVSLLTVTAL